MNTLLEKQNNDLLPEFMATTKLKASNSLPEEMSLGSVAIKVKEICSGISKIYNNFMK